MIVLEPDKSWDIIDSTKLNTFLECPRAYFYEYILGWRPEAPNLHLEFGKAWHLAMEHLIINGYKDESVRDAYMLFYNYYRQFFPEEMDESNAPKNPANALRALQGYVHEYQQDIFTPIYTEIAGTVPIDEGRVLHFRMDSILRTADGLYKSREHKTGSTLSRQWTDQWSLAIQVGTYNHVLYCLYPAEQVGGVEINGVFFQKIENKYQRVPARRSLKMMDVWQWNVLHIMNSIEFETHRMYDSFGLNTMQAFPYNPTNCTKYFGCKYHDFCMSWANPLDHIEEIPFGFKVERWDPSAEESTAKNVFHFDKTYNKDKEV
ncbi:MAG: PD-(D/E)XK nuclease superfamily protein [Parcubacteria group bacterium ADurb.Bin216]|nr:MAG: PD-(D/E)XK nuclease superfamily protein [Parcubacteria group bacterium ADurb.Bin216]